jgi:predicted ArsR family transcriptional regulator
MPESPGRRPQITDEEILDVFRSAADPVLTTGEVAAEFEITHRGVRDRLDKLAEEGTLESKDVGARAKVWWAPGHTETAGRE